MKAHFVVLSTLLIAAACGEAQRADTQQAETQHAETQPAEPAEQPSALEELLPSSLGMIVENWTGDLDGMVERRIVRVVVVSGGPQFFYYQGRPRGVVAELLAMLQRDLNSSLGRRHMQIEVVPMPVSRDRLIPAILSGQADLIAADLTITEARAAQVDFSEPFVEGIDEILVFAPGAGSDVQTLDDLAGREIFVRRSSSYFEHLSALSAKLQARGLTPIDIVEANELLRVEDILEMVDSGLLGATVIDSYKAKYWSAIFDQAEARNDLVVNSGGSIAWAFRKDSPQLAKTVNTFAKKHGKGTLIGNVLVDRYWGNLQWVRNATSDEGLQRLQPLLQHFRSAAAETDLDWLMLVAQAYQESKLDNDKKSPAGAMGIMQIKPTTAADRNVGIDDISSPQDNIRAGARYLRFLVDRYFSDPEMDEMQSWLFGLAAYNAGPAKIQRLRRTAATEGYDPDRWLDNVEVIAAREIGRETVRYVSNIVKYYVAYQMAWEDGSRRRAITTAGRASSN
ncbi:MAG: transporter substrate-binding domain-containing protein [Woeseiaceae bacterium]